MPHSAEDLEEIPFTRDRQENRTGDWRFSIPVLDPEACIQCDHCIMFCPDDVIRETNRAVSVNFDFCKGCGICADVCPTDAFTMEDDS